MEDVLPRRHGGHKGSKKIENGRIRQFDNSTIEDWKMFYHGDTEGIKEARK